MSNLQSFDLLHATTVSLATWISDQDPDRIAFYFEGDKTTYGELAVRIETTAKGLVASGVEPGDRVGFCGLNRLELFEVLFACARLDAIFVPFNNRLTAGELAAQIMDSSPSLLLTTDGFTQLMTDACADRSVRDLDADPFTMADAETVVAQLGPDPDTPQATVLMVYTSGTTGQAKGAMLSHDAMRYTVLNSIDHQQLTADDRVLAPLPTFHVGGLNIQTLPTLYVGGTVVLQRRFDPAEALDLIAQHEVTQTLLVPAMLQAVSAQPGFSKADLSSLRGINTGSSIVPSEVVAPYFDRGVPVGQVYGTTETGPTAVVLDYEEAGEHIGSCGRPATHTELRLVTMHGEDARPGATGEVWLRGPNIFSAYWQNAEATEAAFAPGGWFRTGDVGYRNEAGYVVIVDRIKDVVISGGENIYPAELEPVLLEHPAIAEVAVIGRDDPQWIEVPEAVVVLADGEAVSLDELREWCIDRLARFKHPRRLRIVDELPRTALGKVKKHELRLEPESP